MQAAILLAKLAVFDDEVAARAGGSGRVTRVARRRAAWPRRATCDAVGCAAAPSVLCPIHDRGRGPPGVEAEDARQAGIPDGRALSVPLHLQPCSRPGGRARAGFPVSEAAARGDQPAHAPVPDRSAAATVVAAPCARQCSADAPGHTRHRNHRVSNPASGIGSSRSVASRSSTGVTPAAALHRYLWPDREIDSGALQVHGITDDFLREPAAVRGGRGGTARVHQRRRAGSTRAARRSCLLEKEFARARRRPAVRVARRVCRVLDTLALARRHAPRAAQRSRCALQASTGSTTRSATCTARCSMRSCCSTYLAMTGGRGRSRPRGGQHASPRPVRSAPFVSRWLVVAPSVADCRGGADRIARPAGQEQRPYRLAARSR